MVPESDLLDRSFEESGVYRQTLLFDLVCLRATYESLAVSQGAQSDGDGFALSVHGRVTRELRKASFVAGIVDDLIVVVRLEKLIAPGTHAEQSSIGRLRRAV